jgi:hypothetical protein
LIVRGLCRGEDFSLGLATDLQSFAKPHQWAKKLPIFLATHAGGGNNKTLKKAVPGLISLANLLLSLASQDCHPALVEFDQRANRLSTREFLNVDGTQRGAGEAEIARAGRKPR